MAAEIKADDVSITRLMLKYTPVQWLLSSGCYAVIAMQWLLSSSC